MSGELGGRLDPASTRQYRLLAGAFATSAGRFDEGERLLLRTVEDARAAEAPGEEANALYNLGNLYGRMGRHVEATEALTRAASAALGVDNNGLAALVLTAGDRVSPGRIVRGPRIGISRAVDWPLRFHIRDHPHVSRR